jgi:glucokinase
MILAGDIGGTKTNVGLFRTSGELIRRATYQSADHTGLLPIIQDFLGEQTVAAACFGIAGPVVGNRTRTPNLAWEVDGELLAQEAGLPVVKLINDLSATAEGIPVLQPAEIAELNRGTADEVGNAALIAAGTGLGMSIIARVDGGWQPLPSEGGHQSFAPHDEREQGLLAYLHRELPHVSVERVVSGPGLLHIYRYLREAGVLADAATAQRIEKGDAPAEISRAAEAATCPACAESLRMFLSAYGAAAGDLALTALATGGLYVGGGIAPKLWPRIADGTFRAAFLAKGRLRPLLENIPVYLIRNPDTALRGAARCATRLLGDLS